MQLFFVISVPTLAFDEVPVDQGEPLRQVSLDAGEQIRVEGGLEDVSLLDVAGQKMVQAEELSWRARWRLAVRLILTRYGLLW